MNLITKYMLGIVIIANNWKCEFKKVYRVLCIVRGTLGMIILRLSLKGGFFLHSTIVDLTYHSQNL